MKTYKFPFAIAYADTDAGGIVYHGRYIEIAERARMDMLRGLDMPSDDIGFVVRELDIKYLRPLRLADNVMVESVATNVGAASLEIEQKFVKNDEICAIMHIKVAYIGADMHPKRMPDSVIAVFEEKNE